MQFQRAGRCVRRALVVLFGHQDLALGVPGFGVPGLGRQDLVDLDRPFVVPVRRDADAGQGQVGWQCRPPAPKTDGRVQSPGAMRLPATESAPFPARRRRPVPGWLPPPSLDCPTGSRHVVPEHASAAPGRAKLGLLASGASAACLGLEAASWRSFERPAGWMIADSGRDPRNRKRRHQTATKNGNQCEITVQQY